MLGQARPEHGPEGGVQGRRAGGPRRGPPRCPRIRSAAGLKRRDDAVLPDGDHPGVHASQEPLVVLLDRNDLVVELRVLEADGELARQGLQEVELVAEEGVAGELGSDQDDRHQPAVPDRHRQLGAPGPEFLAAPRADPRPRGRQPTWSRTGAAVSVRQRPDQGASVRDTASAGQRRPGRRAGSREGAKASRSRIRTRMARLSRWRARSIRSAMAVATRAGSAKVPIARLPSRTRARGRRPAGTGTGRPGTHARREPEEEGGRGQAQHHGARAARGSGSPRGRARRGGSRRRSAGPRSAASPRRRPRTG